MWSPTAISENCEALPRLESVARSATPISAPTQQRLGPLNRESEFESFQARTEPSPTQQKSALNLPRSPGDCPSDGVSDRLSRGEHLVGNGRRPRGSCSTYTREDGRVVGEYEADGKKRYIYGRTKNDAVPKLAKAMLIIQNNGPLHYAPPPLPPGYGGIAAVFVR